MKKTGVFLALSMSILLMSCCGCRISGSKQVALLVDSKWILDELDGELIDRPMSDSYTLQFDTSKGSAFGKADCNKYFSSYAIEDKSTIKFSTIGMTKMMCENQKGENNYFSILKKVNGFLINNDELMLLEKGNVRAIFIKTNN